MKYPTPHNTRGNPVSPIAAILMDVRVREQMQELAEGITYAHFEYDPSLPRLLQAPAPVRPEPCDPSYWAPKDYHVPVFYGRTHVHAHRTPRTYGTEALKLAMQAKVRKLMAERADARRAEWNALAAIAA